MMSRKRLNKLFVGLVLVALISFYQYFTSKTILPAPVPSKEVVLGQKDGNFTVTKVIDGDTIEVLSDEKKEKIRIIGINTPETVDPRKSVECFGREASNKAKEILLNQAVRLESDSTQRDRDRYSRLLRYVYLPDGTDFGLRMIQGGYAYEYTYDTPYKFQNEYKKAQIEAETNKLGLWSESSCKGKN